MIVVYHDDRCERCGPTRIEFHVHGDHAQHSVTRCETCDPPCGFCEADRALG
jgi:hypothetical protein